MTPLPGVWRRNLPKGWEWAKLNRVATLGTGHTPDRNRSEYWVDCDVPWVTAADLSSRSSAFEPLLDTAQKVSRIGLAHSAAVEHPAETVMFCRTASVGLFCITGRPMATTQAFVTWTPGPRLHPRYLLYVIAAMGPEFDRLAYGSTHLTIYMPDLESLRIPLPPLDVQRRIADFLDDQVGRIDSVERMRGGQLQTLTERTTSLVDQHLLSPDDPMVKLGNVASLQTGLALNSNLTAEGGQLRPYLRVANVKATGLDLTEIKEVSVSAEQIARHTLRFGDVLMTEGGDRDKLGRGTLWRGEVPNALHQNHVFAIRPRDDRLDPYYLALLTQSSTAREYFEATGNQSTNLASTNASIVLAFRVPLPDVETQRLRVKELEDALSFQAKLRAALEEGRSLLRARKRSLITAAVIGQLDATAASARATRAVMAGTGGAG